MHIIKSWLLDRHLTEVYGLLYYSVTLVNCRLQGYRKKSFVLSNTHFYIFHSVRCIIIGTGKCLKNKQLRDLDYLNYCYLVTTCKTMNQIPL